MLFGNGLRSLSIGMMSDGGGVPISALDLIHRDKWAVPLPQRGRSSVSCFSLDEKTILINMFSGVRQP